MISLFRVNQNIANVSSPNMAILDDIFSAPGINIGNILSKNVRINSIYYEKRKYHDPSKGHQTYGGLVSTL